MKEKRKMARRGFARVEFIANIETIKEMASKGYTLKAIYEKLVEDGKIYYSYSSFCYNASKKNINYDIENKKISINNKKITSEEEKNKNISEEKTINIISEKPSFGICDKSISDLI